MGIQSTPLNPSFNGNLIIDDSNDRFVVSENNMPIGLFGKDLNGNIVVKIAKSGINVLGATPAQLIFNSNQDVFKIVATVTMNIPSFNVNSFTGPGVIANSSTTLMAHNLGYTPVFIGFRYYGSSSNYDQLPYTSVAPNTANNVVGSISTSSHIGTVMDPTNIEVFMSLMLSCFNSNNVPVYAFPAQTLVFYLLQESL